MLSLRGIGVVVVGLAWRVANAIAHSVAHEFKKLITTDNKCPGRRRPGFLGSFGRTSDCCKQAPRPAASDVHLWPVGFSRCQRSTAESPWTAAILARKIRGRFWVAIIIDWALTTNESILACSLFPYTGILETSSPG